MARSIINTNSINLAKANHQTKIREQMIKDKFGGKTGAALEKEMQQSLNSKHILAADMNKRMLEITNFTKVVGSTWQNKKSSKYESIDPEAYTKTAGLFNFFGLKKYQTGNDLIKNVIEFDKLNYSSTQAKVNMNKQALNQAFNNFNNAKEFFTYDLETLSGMGATGFQELDKIQEFSFRKFARNGDGVNEVAGSVETLVGISQREYDKYYKDLVENYDKSGLGGVQKNTVIATRFAKLGHEDTKIDFNAGYGIATTTTFAGDEAVKNYTKEDIIRGMDVARKIGIKQERELASNGLQVWENEFLNSHNIFKNNFTVSYNGGNFDNPAFNQTWAGIWGRMTPEQKAMKAAELGLAPGQIPSMNHAPGMNLDFFDVVKQAASIDGKYSVVDDTKKRFAFAHGKTILQQEVLGSMIDTGSAAHTSGADSIVLANLIGAKQQNGQTLFESMMGTINGDTSGISGILDKNSILVANGSNNFNDWNRKNALNFTIDSRTGDYVTSNGFRLNQKGEILEQNSKYIRNTGVRKNVAYNIDFAGEMEMSEDFVKNIAGTHQEYAQGKIYGLTLTPKINEQLAGGNEAIAQPVHYMFSSKEQMEGMLSQMDLINPTDPESIKNVAERYSKKVIENGVINELGPSSVDDIVNAGTLRLMNDSAARSVREMELSKARKFLDVRDYFGTKKGYSTAEVQRRTLALSTAQNVASGEALKISHEAVSLLGHTYNGQQKNPYTSTLSNAINSYEYMSSQERLIRAAVNEANKYTGAEQQQYAYKTFMENLMSGVESVAGNNQMPVELYAKDANFFDFDLNKLGISKAVANKEIPNVSDGILRTNLGYNKEFNLVNSLLNYTRNDDRILKGANREAYGKIDLMDFIRKANAHEDTKGIFDDILYGKEYSQNMIKIAGLMEERSKVGSEIYKGFADKLTSNVASNEAIEQARKQYLLSIDAVTKSKSNLASFHKQYHGLYEKQMQDHSFSADEWDSFSDEIKAAHKQAQTDLHYKRINAYEELGSKVGKPWRQENADYVQLMHNQINDQNAIVQQRYNAMIDTMGNQTKAEKDALKKEFAEQISKEKGLFTSQIKDIKDASEALRTGGLKDFEDMSVDVLAERVQHSAMNFRKANPNAGYLRSSGMDYVLKADPRMSNAAFTDDWINQSIANSKKSLANITMIGNDVKDYSKVATSLVDDVLMPQIDMGGGKISSKIDDIVRHAERVYGYNAQNSRLLRENLNIQRNAHIEGMTGFIRGITNNNGLVTYDKSLGQVGVIFGDHQMNLNSLAKTRFQNGTLYNRIGRNNVAAGMTIDATKAIRGSQFSTSNVNVVSTLESAYKNIANVGVSINRSMNTGKDPFISIKSSLSRFTVDAMGGSSLGGMSIKDTFASNYLDIDHAVRSLPFFMDEIKAYKGWKDPDFYDIINKNKNQLLNGLHDPSAGIISSQVREAVVKNSKDIVQLITGRGLGKEVNGSDNTINFLISQFNNYGKESSLAKGKVMLGGYNPLRFAHLENISRPPIASTQAMGYRSSAINNAIKNTKSLQNKNIQIGSRIVSEDDKLVRNFDSIGEVASGFTMTTANIAERDFQNLSKAHIDNQIRLAKASGDRTKVAMLERAKEQISGYNLTEQGGIIDGYVANTMLATTETQRISTMKNFVQDTAVNTEMMQKRVSMAMPTFKIDEKSGKVVFEYGNESLVGLHEPLLATKEYGGGIRSIGAKERSGFFGYGYYAEGTNIKLNEQELSEFLTKNKGAVIGADGKINSQRAMDLLGSKFDDYFYVENSFVKGNNKFTKGFAEKGQAKALLSGAGTIDPRVAQALEDMGIGYAKGEVLGDKFIGNLKGSFNAGAGGFKTFDELKAAITGEKFMLSDIVSGIDAFKDVSLYSTGNIIKHDNVGTLMAHMTENLIDLYGGDVNKAVKELDGVFHNSSVVVENGKIVYKNSGAEGAGVVRSKILDLYERNPELKDFGAIRGTDGKILGYKTKDITSFSEDSSGSSSSSYDLPGLKSKLKSKVEELDRANRSGDAAAIESLQKEIAQLSGTIDVASQRDRKMKFSTREYNMMDLRTYDERSMGAIREGLGDNNKELFDKTFGKYMDSEGKVIRDASGREIRWNHSLLDSIDAQAKREWGETTNALSGDGMSLTKRELFHSQADAMRFNSSKIDEKTLLERGYSKKNIGDLVTPLGENNAGLADLSNASYGRNLLIETGLSGSDAFVAMPATDYSLTGKVIDAEGNKVGKTLANDPVQIALNKLQARHDDWQMSKMGEGSVRNGKTLEEIEEGYRSAIGDFRKAVEGGARSTLGDLDSVKLGDYAYQKADVAMMNFTKDKTGKYVADAANSYHMYNKSEFAGKTIGSWAEEGVHLNASWHDKNYFAKYYTEDSMAKHGWKTEAEVTEHLQRYGTFGLEVRTPSIMADSSSLAVQFLDTDLHSNESKSSAALMLMRNQDQDGDNIIHSIRDYQAANGKSGNTYAEFLQARAANDFSKLEKGGQEYFEGLEASLLAHGSTTNKAWMDKAFDILENKEPTMAANTNMFKAMMDSKYSDKEVLYSHRELMADSKRLNDFMGQYSNLKSDMGAEIFKGHEGNDSEILRLMRNHINNNGLTESHGGMLDFMEQWNKDSAAAMSRLAGKASIGEVNIPLHKMKLAASDFDSGSSRNVLNAVTNVLEQGIISKKHGLDKSISNVAMLRKSYNLMSEGNAEGHRMMLDLVSSAGLEEKTIDMVRSTVAGFSNATDDDIRTEITQAMSMVTNLFSKDKSMSTKIDAQILGTSARGSNVDELLNNVSKNSSSIASRILADEGQRVNMNFDTGETKEAMRNIVKQSSNISHGMASGGAASGLAVGALGLAAGIMMAGFIGGNPSKGATNQAQAEHGNGEDSYGSLQDRDLEISQLPQGSGQGYVININATSNKGQAHVQQAIQKAMQSATPTDINISMNVSDKTSNINSRFIDKLLSGAL